MSKIGIIIGQEYKNRVVKKSFIILTFLMPVLFLAIIFVPIWLAQIGDDTEKVVAVVDQTGLYNTVFENDGSYTYVMVDDAVNNIQETSNKNNYNAIVVISEDLLENPKGVTIFSEKQVGLDLKNNVRNKLTKYVEEQKLLSYNIENLQQIIKDSKVNLDVATIKWGVDGTEQESSSELALIVGMVATMLIYMFIFISGAQVMNSVVQEKTSRIVEVMICSVKPFELMMGKVISVALVCLTQFFMWFLLTGILLFAATQIMGAGGGAEELLQAQQGMNQIEVTEQVGGTAGMAQEVLGMLSMVNWVEILSFFIIYFIGGYLLYASLFAAIGSAVDNETDTQQFMMPITIIILFALYAGIYSAENPDGPLAFWCSMIPFTSPIVMMVRLPFDVPMWEKLVSISLLILTFIGTTWLSAKIYRTGILMYGKKVSWKEIAKWVRY